LSALQKGGSEDDFAGEFADETEAIIDFRREKRRVYRSQTGREGRIRTAVTAVRRDGQLPQARVLSIVVVFVADAAG
jgi:hypothetical protein